ncbi:MAG: LolA family protein [Cellulomonas sp.]
MTRTWPRWLPAAIVPAVIAAGALVNASQAGAAADLPDKTAAEVLTLVGESSVTALSGTIEQTSTLGLPAVPSTGPGADGSGMGSGVGAALELLTGSHTARVYLDGPTRIRAQVLDPLAERDVVRDGDQVWLYNSEGNAATHLVLPAAAPGEEQPTPDGVLTPAALAEKLLGGIDSSTRVTVDPDTVVAGRPAYELLLTPRSTDTLVGSVSIAVDAESGLPLSVDLMAKGQSEPAFRVAFTQISLDAPPAERFQFAPPPGATVTEQTVPTLPDSTPGAGPGLGQTDSLPGLGRPTVTGTGWDAVVEVALGPAAPTLTGSPLLEELTQSVAGGRFLHTALLNVLLTDDGRLLVGSVPLERLQASVTGR